MPLEWEIWLDTHISPAIAKWMADYTGFIVKSSYTLSLHELDDLVIYQKAKDYGKVILFSKDVDFSELISRLGSPPKLISLKIGNCDNRTLWELIRPEIQEAIKILINSDIDIVELESERG
jgi:predicted nuclease of predicted toxin-antitoxin system